MSANDDSVPCEIMFLYLKRLTTIRRLYKVRFEAITFRQGAEFR
jgi:hypothetical protein